MKEKNDSVYNHGWRVRDVSKLIDDTLHVYNSFDELVSLFLIAVDDMLKDDLPMLKKNGSPERDLFVDFIDMANAVISTGYYCVANFDHEIAGIASTTLKLVKLLK